MKNCIRCDSIWEKIMESESHRMAWFGGDCQDHPVPASPALERDIFTRPGCSELWTTWPGTLAGIQHS